MNLKIILLILMLLIPGFNSVIPVENNSLDTNVDSPTIIFNIDPESTIYEGDIIDCNITGNPTVLYWKINDGNPHYVFHNNKPVIFDPEPTPLDDDYVDLTIYAENEFGSSSESIKVKIKRLFFGDIHWHTQLCDGDYPLDEMYKNAIKDNYLDFACYSGHAEWIDGLSKSSIKYNWRTPIDIVRNIWCFRVFMQNLIHYLKNGYNDWESIKQKANEYYDEGNFSTFIGFEWSGNDESNFHVNFYYKDSYPDAKEYSSSNVLKEKDCKPSLEDVFQAMSDEHKKGHLSIAYPHHPLFVEINWTHLANDVNKTNRNKILRGVEVYSTWGNSIGNKFTPNLPFPWPSYHPKNALDRDDAYVENALWEFSNNSNKYQKFGFIASSDTHKTNRPGSARNELSLHRKPYYPSGIIAAYSVHNNRSEIWDAMDVCDSYATQLLKIRVNVRVDGQIAYGRWINCSSPLNITVTAMSTFSGLDNSGKTMCPHSYSEEELDYPIQDIWLIKKDTDKGKPWCKIINYSSPNKTVAVETFQDFDVQPNDFYWVAIRQKGQYLVPEELTFLVNFFPRVAESYLKEIYHRDNFMTYIGPIFIDNVI